MRKILQKWEGQVLSVSENSFWAILHDLTNNTPDVEAHIDKKAICKKDLLVPGALFFWYIRERESVIKFRKLRWTKKQIEQAEKDE